MSERVWRLDFSGPVARLRAALDVGGPPQRWVCLGQGLKRPTLEQSQSGQAMEQGPGQPRGRKLGATLGTLVGMVGLRAAELGESMTAVGDPDIR